MRRAYKRSAPAASEDPGIASAVVALEFLSAMLRDGADLDRLLDGYLETRRLLAEVFGRIARSTIPPASAIMEETRERLRATMHSRYGAAVPDDLITVRAYGDTHVMLLGYLYRRVGDNVSASKLRLITGDQVHTERRVRELRDLGFRIEAGRVAGEFQYQLVSSEPNLEYASLVQLRINIKRSRTLPAIQKRQLLSMLADGAP